MVEIADIFRLHGPEYRSQFRDRMPPSHLRTMDAIEHCRTEALGGQLYFCDECLATGQKFDNLPPENKIEAFEVGH